jgi:hypothetical protein
MNKARLLPDCCRRNRKSTMYIELKIRIMRIQPFFKAKNNADMFEKLPWEHPWLLGIELG